MKPKSRKKTKKQIVLRFGLLDNALDYLLSSAEYAKSGDQRSLKYSVLHLAAAVELLLKARLQKEHWSLVFSDVDKARREDLESGDFVSVDFSTAVKRLSGIVGVSLKDDKETFEHLDKLWKLRNKLQHFSFEEREGEVKARVSTVANFCIDFCERELSEDIDSNGEDLIDQIKEHLFEIEEFVSARMHSIRDELEKARLVIDCPECWQHALAVGLEEGECKFCQAWLGLDALASALEDEARHRSGDAVEECPQCENMTCIFSPNTGEGGGWGCLLCDEEGQYDRCNSCNRLFDSGDGCPTCPDCIEAVFNNPHS